MAESRCLSHGSEPMPLELLQVGEFVWRPGVVTEALQKGRPHNLQPVMRTNLLVSPNRQVAGVGGCG